MQKTLIMKLIIRTLFSALFLAVIFSACKSEPAKKQKDFDAIAKELCDCMQPLAEWNAKVKEISATQDEEAVKKMFDELGGISEKSYACADKLEQKYGEITADEEEQAEEALQKACPQIAEFMNQVKDLENAQ